MPVVASLTSYNYNLTRGQVNHNLILTYFLTLDLSRISRMHTTKTACAPICKQKKLHTQWFNNFGLKRSPHGLDC